MSDDRQNYEPKDQPLEGGIDAAEEERMIRIMQYCDGVLPAREAAAVADEIARDPEAARLAAEMAAGANAARSAWGEVDADPLPFDLARRVTQSARRPVQAPAKIDWKIAAALVLGVGLGTLGLLLAQHNDAGLRLAGTDNESMMQGSGHAWQPALMAALAKEPETAQVAFGTGDNAVNIARWFDTAAGLHCAEFARTNAGAVAGGGIACKKPDGGWDVIEQQR
jgi:anti-sigma factor RsiW